MQFFSGSLEQFYPDDFLGAANDYMSTSKNMSVQTFLMLPASETGSISHSVNFSTLS